MFWLDDNPSTYPSYSTVDEAVKAANLVVEGNILDKEYKMLDITYDEEGNDPKENPGGSKEPSPELPYTIYKVKVSKVYKGDITEGDTIGVKVLGGKFKDAQYIVQDSMPELSNQTQYTLFLSTFEDSPASLVNLTDSVFVSEDGYLQAVNSKSSMKRFSADELMK